MFLADLKTQIEKEAFISLAYLVAKACGSLGYAEQTLIKLYCKEMGMNHLHCSLQQTPLITLCQVFSDQHSKQVVFTNLLFLVRVGEYDSEGQRSILEVIQRELAINPIEAKNYEDEMKILKGCYFPEYID